VARRSLEFSSVVSNEGKSVELALENLREAIELYLRDEDTKVPEANYRPIVTVVEVVRA